MGSKCMGIFKVIDNTWPNWISGRLDKAILLLVLCDILADFTGL